jgi:hypothetical protein
MAKIYGELEVAQLEGFATVDLPDPTLNLRRVVYDLTEEKIKVSNGTIWKAGSTSLPVYQFTVGADSDADYTTLALALADHPSNTSFLLHNSYVAAEDVTITGDGIYISGQGAQSVITGNIVVDAGAMYNKITNLKVTGNITTNIGAKYNDISNAWIANTSVVTDNGSSNNILLIKDE